LDWSLTGRACYRINIGHSYEARRKAKPQAYRRLKCPVSIAEQDRNASELVEDNQVGVSLLLRSATVTELALLPTGKSRRAAKETNCACRQQGSNNDEIKGWLGPGLDNA